MKYVSRISLVKRESLLSKEEMKKIVGKGTYRCCCGMDGNAPCFNVTVPTIDDALLVLSEACKNGYYGLGGCFLS